MFPVMKAGFRDAVPHNAALGMELVDVGAHSASLRLPYDAKLAGDPETGVLHGGVITTLIDATCGAAVFAEVEAAIPVATLDLRIDYLKPATPGLDVIAAAHVIKRTRNIAFVRATAFHDGAKDNPIAAASGTFMLQTIGRAVNALAERKNS